MPGTLYVVATPIGNLEDITLRALRTLREVDLIAAEDTRRTAKLLARHNIQKPMVSLHAHNEGREAPKLIERLVGGASIAVVSDAGTPGISDPGEHLVRLARDRGLPVTPIPGPSAITAALSVSGLPASQFTFMGFPPRGGEARREWMREIKETRRTVVAFEAPHRVERTLAELTQLAKRPIHVYRELSKIHEQLAISPIKATEILPSQGEFVLLVGVSSDNSLMPQDTSDVAKTAVSMVGCMTINGTFSQEAAIELAAKAVGLDVRAVQKAVKKSKIQEKQRRAGVS